MLEASAQVDGRLRLAAISALDRIHGPILDESRSTAATTSRYSASVSRTVTILTRGFSLGGRPVCGVTTRL